ncbi:Uncharacterized protein TCM_030460 [Theobroma cacao]|uniref:Uncharacterized protein n=1 Tax=Theobroma cacao TaxID=3641 RepID=A0A061GHX5_THECC|nr:Uncharacterized protein TCM_030460 [Theobroma cacao]
MTSKLPGYTCHPVPRPFFLFHAPVFLCVHVSYIPFHRIAMANADSKVHYTMRLQPTPRIEIPSPILGLFHK